jgi:glycosyltransferase involved in cell wall biosynthesis
MKSKNIVILSSDDWGWKTSKYQLSTRFARDNKVLFVSSVGFRSATVSKQDIFRIFKKLRKFVKGVEIISPTLFVLTPLVIPFRKYQFVNKLNEIILKIQIHYALHKLNISEPYLFVFSQNWLCMVRNFQRKKLIYYCVDEHSGFNGIDSQRFIQNDKEMAQLADVVICSSRKLEEQKMEINSNTYYIPHGVNYKLFSRAVYDDTLTLPSDVANIPSPIFGFYGHVSHEWVDGVLLKFVASARPEWTIMLIGKNSMNPDEFSEYKNIHLIGERDYEDLPAYSKSFSVAIIPFVKSLLTDNCNPLKLYEYLSAGLPVVSTDIPEVRQYENLVHIANSYENFLHLCDVSLDEGDAAMKVMRSNAMSHSSWDERVNQIYHILKD